MKMFKIIGLIGLVLLIFAGTYNLFFSSVKFNYIYNEVVNVSEIKSKDFIEVMNKGTYIFANKDEWDSFRQKHLKNYPIPKTVGSNGQILLTFNDFTLGENNEIFSVDNIEKRFLTLNVNLNKNGNIKTVSGLDINAKYKAVMIYGVEVGGFSAIYSPKLNVNKS